MSESTDRGSENTHQRLGRSELVGLVAALFLLVLGAHFVYGGEASRWPNVAACALSAVAVLFAVRSSGHVDRLFLLLLAASLTFQGIEEAIYTGTGPDDIALWMILHLLGVFFWMCAWGLLALQLFRRASTSPFLSAMSLLPLLALIAAYFAFYLEHDPDWVSPAFRFRVVLAGFELMGLITGLMCVLLGVGRPLTLMVAGFALFASSDFVFLSGATPDYEEAIGPVWLLGRFLILAGAVALPPLRVGLPSGLPESSRVRSGVAGILVIVAVTMVLGVGLVEAVSTDGRPAELEGVVFVLACVVFVIVIAGVARRFDRAVAFLGRWVEDLVDNRLTPAAWEGGGVVSRSTLRITRLDSLFKLIASAAGRLRNDVIFLGPERLYPVYGPGPETKQVSCFVVMPFGLPWSDEVHATIRRAAEAQGVQSIRGDDIFTPTDILTDIWIGINRADFIIADITGRNANVLYELGIAHTLAKPVLILTQSVEDVPIDLATRRMIVYGDPKSGELRQKLDKGIGEILDEYDWSREAPGRGLRSTASEHDDPVDRADRD